MVDVGSGQQYQSLYRRYRPQTFGEVRGQEHIALALRNAVRDDKVVHAYLFSGPRGTGKTSTARILAKALNCLAPVNGEPCGHCESCVEIARGASLDVHELDAASNNGVDAMRDLVARAALATPGKWKVYIVDEVHMLSTAASNALLKTLEEPPSHVVFVLATTDPQKVLPTIRSRTQHYEFHLLEPEVLEALLTEIATDARLELPTGAIEAAVRRGHGSARDAVSALDQIVAAGVADNETRYLERIITAIAERESGAVLAAVAEAMAAGNDAGRLGDELVDALRSVFLSTVAPGLLRHSQGEGAAVSPSDRPLLTPARCVRALEVLGTALVDMREALDPRITLEVALVRLTAPEADDTPAALLDRLERLERRVEELSASPSPGGGKGGAGAGGVVAPAASGSPAASGASTSSGVPAGFAAPPPARPVADPPAPSASAPGASTSDARPALGAFRTRRESAAPAPPETMSPAPSSMTATAVATLPDSEPDPSPIAASPGPAAESGRSSPTRDDIVTAWGDSVLPGLRPRAKAVLAAGRWLSAEPGTAVFALPNSAHVDRAEPFRNEMASALSTYFDRPIEVALEVDSDDVLDARRQQPERTVTATASGEPNGRQPRPSSPAASSPVETTSSYDEIEEIDDVAPASDAGPHDSVSWAESRLLDVFPGAEEVT